MKTLKRHDISRGFTHHFELRNQVNQSLAKSLMGSYTRSIMCLGWELSACLLMIWYDCERINPDKWHDKRIQMFAVPLIPCYHFCTRRTCCNLAIRQLIISMVFVTCLINFRALVYQHSLTRIKTWISKHTLFSVLCNYPSTRYFWFYHHLNLAPVDI